MQRNKAFFQHHGRVLGIDNLARLASSIKTRAFGRGVWSVFVLHEVIPFDQLNTTSTFSPYPLEYFEPFARWLAGQARSESVWIDTVTSIMKYLKERDTFVYRIIKEDHDTIEMQIDHGMDKATFTFPLTIDVLVPRTWKEVIISTGGSKKDTEHHETWEYQHRVYARFKAIPAGQTVLLERSRA